MAVVGELPRDVRLQELNRHVDMRGDLCELSRESWPETFAAAQWNVLHTRAEWLRGMSVHLRLVDAYFAVEGEILFGVSDLRRDSPSFRKGCVVALDGDRPLIVTVPRGIAHGIYSVGDSIVLAKLSQSFDPDDKLGCRWDDPLLGIPWPEISPRLIERDAAWPPADDLVRIISVCLAGCRGA
jgi:dTDP-4-dehydrorhamnose 3,5-epimerase